MFLNNNGLQGLQSLHTTNRNSTINNLAFETILIYNNPLFPITYTVFDGFILELDYRRMNGTLVLPQELFHLTRSTRLYLSDDFSGDLSTGNASQPLWLWLFRYVDQSVASWELVGWLSMIPTRMIMSRLQHLDNVSSNALTGTIPADLNEMKELTCSDLSHNSLTGPLAPLSSLQALQTLCIGGNSLSGALPRTEIGLLTELLELYASLPTELG